MALNRISKFGEKKKLTLRACSFACIILYRMIREDGF